MSRARERWGREGEEEGGRHLVSSGVQNGGLDVLVEILWPRRADHLNVTVGASTGANGKGRVERERVSHTGQADERCRGRRSLAG